MQQYFVNSTIGSDTIVEIDDKELYQHLIKVLRMKLGSKCLLVDNSEKIYIATLESESDKILKFNVTEDTKSVNTEFEFYPIVACSLSKKDKIEWIAQKATELGAKEISFFTSKYSIMKWDSKVEKKIERLNQIVKNAAQQSHRRMVPKIVYFESLKKLVAHYESDIKLVAYEEVAKTGEPTNLAKNFDNLKKGQSIISLYGPEGGFDESEIEYLSINNFQKIGLGPRILRAETAPLYFLSALSYRFDLM